MKRSVLSSPSLARESRNKRGRCDVYVLLCDLGTLDGTRTHRCTHQRISIFSCSFKVVVFQKFSTSFLLLLIQLLLQLLLQLPATEVKLSQHHYLLEKAILY